MDKLQHELKKEFQLERMILFSDAVFAIAITLLVIEIKVPHIEANVTDAAITEELVHLLPKFFGFLISFFIIGIYWTVHHRMFGYLIDYNQKIIWLNIFFLLSIAIMPFTNALYGEFYQPTLLVPYTVYTANIFLTGIFNSLLWRHIGNPANNVSLAIDENIIKAGVARSWMMPVIFAVGLVISLLLPPQLHWVGRLAPGLTPFYMMLVSRLYGPKKQVEADVEE